MKSPADRLLSDADKEKIRAAVREAEIRTAGEIVPMVVPASYDYPMADVTGAVAFSLPLAIVLTPVIGGRFWIGPQNMWVFLGTFALLYAFFFLVIRRVPPLKRLFISKAEIDEEVEEAAVSAFYQEGLYRTRDETGVLIFISMFEKKVWILADKGINEKVGKEQWQGIAGHIAGGIHTGRQVNALCDAVSMVGDLLATHFPAGRENPDELSNLIVGE